MLVPKNLVQGNCFRVDSTLYDLTEISVVSVPVKMLHGQPLMPILLTTKPEEQYQEHNHHQNKNPEKPRTVLW